MAHLLILFGQKEPTNIMLNEFFDSISDKWAIEKQSVAVDELSIDLLLWSDIVMGVRTQNSLEADIMACAKQNGKTVIEMLDDDFFSIPDWTIRRPLQKRALLKALKNADYLLGSNEKLLNTYLAFTNNATVCTLPTAVDEKDIITKSKNISDEYNIAYYVNDSDCANFNKIIKPILGEIQLVMPGQIHWHFFSVRPDMSNTPYENSVTYYPPMPLSDFRYTLANSGIDIGIAPLIDNGFNSNKYVNKFFEYSRAGIPAIYSNVTPYSGFVVDNENGILAANSNSSWLDAFKRISSNELREKIKRISQNELKHKYSNEAVATKMVSVIPELVADSTAWKRKPSIKFLKIKKQLYVLADKPLRAIARLKVEGVKSTFNWVMSKYLLK